MKHRPKILIVDDDDLITKGLRELLEAEEYTVATASDGENGLARARGLHPDLVLLDVNLPRLDGLGVCRTLRADGFRNPILMISARREPAARAEGLAAGADDYLGKPLVPRDLISRVRESLLQAGRRAAAGGPGGGRTAGSARTRDRRKP